MHDQMKRFLRLFAAAVLTQAVALDFEHLTRSAAMAAVIAALEVAYRQAVPVTTVPPTVGDDGESV